MRHRVTINKRRCRHWTWAAVLVAAALLASACSAKSGDADPAPSSVATTVAATVATTVTTTGLRAVTSDGQVTVSIPEPSLDGKGAVTIERVAPPAPELLSDVPGAIEAVGQAFRVDLANARLTGPAAITITLPPDFDPQRGPPFLLWERSDGNGFEFHESTWDRSNNTISATLTHFSFGFLAQFAPGRIAKAIGDELQNLFNGVVGVAQPTCGGEKELRDQQVVVGSDANYMVKWCLGFEEGAAVLRVANDWRAGITVTFPKNWGVIDYRGSGFNLQAIADWLDSKKLETSRTFSRLLPAGSTITLRPQLPEPGQVVDVDVELSFFSWNWSILLLAVEVFLKVVADIAGKSVDLAQKLLAAQIEMGLALQCLTSTYGDTLDPTRKFDPSEATDTETLKKTLVAVVDCADEPLKQAAKKIGLGALATALSIAVGSVYGLVNALAAGPVAGAILLTDDFDGTIRIAVRETPKSPPTTQPAPSRIKNTTVDGRAVPAAVLAKAELILAAAEAEDYAKLVALTEPKVFRYTFGRPHPEGVAGYWRDYKPGPSYPGSIASHMVTALAVTPTVTSNGIYLWEEPGNGWRLYIDAAGTWKYFVTGD